MYLKHLIYRLSSLLKYKIVRYFPSFLAAIETAALYKDFTQMSKQEKFKSNLFPYLPRRTFVMKTYCSGPRPP